MKNFYLLCTFLLCTYISHSQIVNIGDSRFKAAILNTGIDINNDGEIQLSEASTLTSLNASYISARTFQGIEHFTNLTNLNIGSSVSGADSENIDLRTLTNLEVLYLSNFSFEINLSGLSNLRVLECNTNPNKIDITGLTGLEEFSYWSFITNGPNYYVNHLINLKELDLAGRGLTWLDVGNLTNLEKLYCDQNQLTTIDLSNLTNLIQFSCVQNQLTSLDVSHNNITNTLAFSYNPLETLNVKDGNVNYFSGYGFENTNIQSICCDANELSNLQSATANSGFPNVTFETNCAPTPTGTLYYTIQGKNTLDSNLNGCDAGDNFLPEVEYTISNGSDDLTIYTDKFGNYEFIGKAGTYTITPSVPNTSYYSFSASSVTVNLPADGTTVIHDFCVTPNGPPIVTTLPLDLKNKLLAQGNIDTNNDGEIQITEAESVTNLSVLTPVIKGLDDFINIETLSCNASLFDDIYNTTRVSYLDVSPLVNLKNLYVTGNLIATLDVSQNVNLERLDCRGNLLNSLLLTNNTNLKYLYCGNLSGNSDIPYGVYTPVNKNTFKTLDLSTNSQLEYLTCSFATTDGIIFGSNTNLETIFCINSGLTSLDISQLPNLKTLHCYTDDSTNDYIPDGLPNQITALDTSQNTNLQTLLCYKNAITSLDVSLNTNLQTLSCSDNLLTSIDISQNNNLFHLNCGNNPLTTFDVSQNTGLKTLGCANTGLTTLDFSPFPELYSVNCSNNQLTTIDISQNPALRYLDCSNNVITQLFVKNGNDFATTVTDDYYYTYYFRYYGNPVEYICADDFEIDEIIYRMPTNINAAVNTYCSFTPGGSYNTIEGTVRFDENGNGCDTNDNPYQYLNLNLTNSTNETSSVATQNDGSYAFHFSDDGIYTLTPVIENPSYFTISPASVTVDFPTDTSPFTQDFCITPNGTHNDVDVTLIPLNQARPGFDSNYKIIYKNKGNTTLSGDISLIFNDDFMDFMSANLAVATQTTNSLQWNYANLAPFESREILFTMNLNTPTDPFSLNADDVLEFTTTITPVIADETMDDNTFTLSQIVVNSYDPNDKTCLQGDQVITDFIGKYVDYMIRFENLGTANALNVVVKDEIDISMFDPNSIIITNASHAVVTRITNTNTVEFIFENINLPFDDASNDGYVTFKIKTLSTLVENDTFENEAEIYFDYNFPIATNRMITTIKNSLSTPNFEVAFAEIYPNPVKDRLNIQTKEAIETITIYDIAGRIMQQKSYTTIQNRIEIATATFTQGTYFVKIKTASGVTLVKKIVKG